MNTTDGTAPTIHCPHGIYWDMPSPRGCKPTIEEHTAALRTRPEWYLRAHGHIAPDTVTVGRNWVGGAS